jgi:hypothetical protein
MMKEVYFRGLEENYGLYWSHSGQTAGLHIYGYVNNFSMVFIHHSTLACSIKHWTLPYLFLFSLSLSMLPLTYMLNDRVDATHCSHSLSHITTSPTFWLQVVLLTSLGFLPVYSCQRISQLII